VVFFTYLSKKTGSNRILSVCAKAAHTQNATSIFRDRFLCQYTCGWRLMQAQAREMIEKIRICRAKLDKS
jgi:hypothetical protein